MKTAMIALAAVVALSGGAEAATRSVEVLLHDRPLHIAPETIQAVVGDTLALSVSNPPENTGPHDFRLDDFDVMTPLLNPGQSVAVSAVVDRAGTFEYWCSVPGHRDGGMVGTLVVAAAGDTAQPPPSGDEEEKGSPAAATVVGALAAAGCALLLRRRP